MKNFPAFDVLDEIVREQLSVHGLVPERGIKKKDLIASWIWRRADSLYEGIYVQKGSASNGNISLNIDCVVHYFQECPIPAGVFGVSPNIIDLLSDGILDRVSSHIGGLNWLHFEAANLRNDLVRFFRNISPDVRVGLDNLAKQLLCDRFLKEAYAYGISLSSSSPISYEEINRNILTFGEPLPRRGLAYSSSKAAGQIHAWLAGFDNWSEI